MLANLIHKHEYAHASSMQTTYIRKRNKIRSFPDNLHVRDECNALTCCNNEFYFSFESSDPVPNTVFIHTDDSRIVRPHLDLTPRAMCSTVILKQPCINKPIPVLEHCSYQHNK